jgi:hypothetical protein
MESDDIIVNDEECKDYVGGVAWRNFKVRQYSPDHNQNWFAYQMQEKIIFNENRHLL